MMATWNRAWVVGRTIESVREQSFKDWELIIADDGSTDNTPEIVSKWRERESRIVYVRSEINEGISKNYNQGLRIARGEYVAMIDDDDPWCDKDKLKKQVEFLDKNREYVGCGGGVIVTDSGGEPARHASLGGVAGRELYRYLKPQSDEAIRARMLFSNPMANSTTLWRRSVGEAAHWYDETTRYSGDRDFWLKIGLKGKLCNFPEYFSYYTMGDANTSIAKIRPHLKASLMIMQRYKKNYPHYLPALALNWLQYLYAFLPNFIQRFVHRSLARLKRTIVG